MAKNVICEVSDLDFDHQNQFILESKWMIEPDLKKFPQGFPEISGSQELDRWTDGQTENMMLQDTAIAQRHKNYLESVHSAVNDKNDATDDVCYIAFLPIDELLV